MEVSAVSEPHEDQSAEAEEVEFDSAHDEAQEESGQVTEESENPSDEESTTRNDGEEAEDTLFVNPDDDEAAEFAPLAQKKKEGEEEEHAQDGTAVDSEPWKVRISELEEELSSLGEHLAGAHKERDDTKSRLLRTAADLDNMRKRREREQEEQQKFGAKRLALDLLPAVDNLARALEHSAVAQGDGGIVEGIQMVNKQIVGTLEKHGIRSFDSLGEQFDPQRHEAMQQVETPDHQTGEIINEFQKGYFIHDRLLRPAWVVVAKRIEPAPEADPEPGGVIDIGPEGADGEVEASVTEPVLEDSESEEEA